MNMIDKFKKFKKSAAQKEQHICPNCGGEMCLKKGLTHSFMHNGAAIDVPDITAMVCDDCGKMYFDWGEVERIKEFVWHEMKPVEETQQ